MTTTQSVAGLIFDGEKRLAAGGIPSARLEAEVLLARRLSVERGALLLHAGDTVAPAVLAKFLEDIDRRSARYPLQYITGVQEFYSLAFEVDERVLIPRPETELIVDEVLRLSREAAQTTGSETRGPGEARNLRLGKEVSEIVDVGTGSGCLAVALAVNIPPLEIMAIDISPGALEVARRNAERHQVGRVIRFVEGDGLAPALGLRSGRWADFVVSNPPYISEADLEGLQPELRYEPRVALCPGSDGLTFTARLVRDAAMVLKEGGWLLIELSAGRSEEARRLVDPCLWEDLDVRPDLQGIPRLLRARRR